MSTNQELIDSIITNLNSLLSPATSEKSGLMGKLDKTVVDLLSGGGHMT